MVTNSLPTGQNLKERMGIGDRNCAMCGAKVEDAMHIFKQCQVIRVLAFATFWGCCLDSWSIANMKTWIEQSLKTPMELK